MKRISNDQEARDVESSTGLKLFGGSGNVMLAERIAASVGLALGKVKTEHFPDGEVIVKLEDDVRGRDCFVVQPTCPPVNETLMELLIFIDCLRRASARRITAVVPYFGYARQDRKSEGRTPITAKLVANLITEAGADRVLTMDLHAEQIQGFFDIPVDHLSAEPVFTRYFKKKNITNGVVVSPDVGNLKKIDHYLSSIGPNLDLAVIDKRRIDGGSIVARNIIGSVEGKTVLMFDDMITTAGTMTEAIKLVRHRGAKEVYVSATHPVLAGPAVDRLASADITQICVSDTIPLKEDARQRLKNIKILSVADLLGEAIRRIHRNESVSSLLNQAPNHVG
jgi:ribose-phosphate pyrophosphokinase